MTSPNRANIERFIAYLEQVSDANFSFMNSTTRPCVVGHLMKMLKVSGHGISVPSVQETAAKFLGISLEDMYEMSFALKYEESRPPGHEDFDFTRARAVNMLRNLIVTGVVDYGAPAIVPETPILDKITPKEIDDLWLDKQALHVLLAATKDFIGPEITQARKRAQALMKRLALNGH